MFNKLKKLLLLVLLAGSGLTVIASCDSKIDYADARQEVLALHDKVMVESGKSEGVQLQFKELLKSGLGNVKTDKPTLDTAALKLELISLIVKLNEADTSMENWMHAYNNDFKGKTDQESTDYFNSQKFKILKIDSLYKNALQSSFSVLKLLKAKPFCPPVMNSKMKM